MNAKKLVVLAVALGLFAISTANVHAQMHRNAGFTSRASTSRSFVTPGAGTFTGRNGGSSNWHHHHGDCGSSIFVSSFGFPFFGFGYPYSYGYPYGYGYGYGGYYPYSSYGAGYYGGGYYNSGYYGGGYYGAPAYSSYGYGAGYAGQSSVARLQRQLARAGYYRGPIDGIMGSRTRYALRAYRHDHGGGARETADRQPY
jgi:Putative peptidoglycan binding domain